MKVNFFYHDTFLQHIAGLGHPERPERLEAIVNALKKEQLDRQITWSKPTQAAVEDLTRVHNMLHVERVLATRGKSTIFDGDTRTCPQSIDAALLAAGAVVNAVDFVLDNPETTAFCAVRPPGHHAERARSMGFCLFNNVAIGAAYAIDIKKLQRVFIFDPDVHHGNGTQDIFYRRRDVFYASIHQFPYYPGTGAVDESGIGPGAGYNANFPLNAGMGDEEYIYLGTVLRDIIREYQPQLILFSAGFDAHHLDPLAHMQVTSEGFWQLYAPILQIAQQQKIPYAFVLEGGYSLEALGETVSLLIRSLLAGEFSVKNSFDAPHADSYMVQLANVIRKQLAMRAHP